MPTGYGFVNASATNPGGSTSQFSQCQALTTSTCTYTLTPTSQIFAPGSSANNHFNITTQGGCPWTASTNDNWITFVGNVTGTGNGTITYSIAANPSASQRTGAISVAGQSFSITQAGTQSGPLVSLACRDKKALVVTGAGFVDGAQLFINGAKQKKVFVDSPTQITARKAGKFIVPGDSIQVVNPDNSASTPFTYTPCASSSRARKD